MKFAEQLVSVVVRDPEHRDSIMGDLREEYARQLRRSGAARATRWHLRQSAGIAMRYGVARLLRRKPPVRWIAIAEHDTDGRWWTGLTRDVSTRGARSPSAPPFLSWSSSRWRWPCRQQHDLQPAGRAGPAPVPLRGSRPPDDSHDHGARRQLLRSRERLGAPISAMAACVDDRRAAGRCTSGGTPTSRASTRRASAGFVSPDSLRLGSPPALGREFHDDEAEPGQHRVVLGHALWARRFGGGPAHCRHDGALRRRAVRSGRRCAGGFQDPDGAELWAPLALTAAWAEPARRTPRRLARLADGASSNSARGADHDHRHRSGAIIRRPTVSRYARVCLYERHGRPRRRPVHRRSGRPRPSCCC